MGSSKRIAPGHKFGNLHIERELGRGAFATVFLAKDTLIGRQVALKVMRAPAAIAPTEERERILREARLVAKLNSQHIVTLYRVHELEDGGWMFEMEYVEGGTLDDLMKKHGRLPVNETLRVLLGVLSALRDAHAHEVIHRDVKPGNVLIGKDGAVKLTDFGLGSTVGEASLSASSGARILGTPLYMAPEVVMGESPTLTSDLWSVGVILYRMLSGRHPFQANNLPNLFIKIQNAEAPALREDAPRELCELAMTCLRKRAVDRPVSADAMLGLIDRIITTSTDLPREAISAIMPRPRLIGRQKELSRLDEYLQTVTEGRGATVLITGEAGAGKTTLMQELALHAGRHGFRWLEANVTSLGGLLRP
ncbi:MAG: serine/threonine-protein kinase, partial [Planctomycetota bacterium]|nr:serine/threonine-protein kinase [Planctomycetota bacterium]